MLRNVTVLMFVCLNILGLPSGYAEDTKSTPLLLPSDIQTAAAPVLFQGVQSGPSGAVHFPDLVLASRLAKNTENSTLIESWGKSHSFFVVPLNVGVAPAEGLIPESVSLTVALPALGQLDRQPIVIDTFPKTGFAASALSGKAEVKVGTDLKFAEVAPVGITGGANASLSYSYAPAYANAVAGFGSGSAFWRFSRTQEKYPIGDIPIKLILAVPKSHDKAPLVMAVDVRGDYPGGWIASRGLSVASFRARVALPEGQN